jgi:hypothetical protein
MSPMLQVSDARPRRHQEPTIELGDLGFSARIAIKL